MFIIYGIIIYFTMSMLHNRCENKRIKKESLPIEAHPSEFDPPHLLWDYSAIFVLICWVGLTLVCYLNR